MNKEEFIRKSVEKFGLIYDYSRFVYISEKIEGEIICPIHGSFFQTPKNHLRRKIACPKCFIEESINNRKEDFIEKANKRYNFFFDYSKFQYVNAKTKSIIICPFHGEFEQTPDKHLQGIYPCPLCEKERKENFEKSDETKRKISENKKREVQYFLKKAHEKFGNTFEYDFSNYTGMVGNPIKIKCLKHGWFEKVPHVFLISNCGCTKCGMEKKNKSKTKSYYSFVKESSELFKNKYSYPDYNVNNYINRNSIVDIMCEKHGVFQKRAIKHLAGQGCFKCKVEELIKEGKLPGGYSYDLFLKNKDIGNKIGWLYYIKINDGQYYKIGITLNLKRRLGSLKSMFGNIECVYTKEERLEDAFYAEQLILNRFKYFRVYLSKSSELFSTDISNDTDFLKLFNF